MLNCENASQNFYIQRCLNIEASICLPSTPFLFLHQTGFYFVLNFPEKVLTGQKTKQKNKKLFPDPTLIFHYWGNREITFREPIYLFILTDTFQCTYILSRVVESAETVLNKICPLSSRICQSSWGKRLLKQSDNC